MSGVSRSACGVSESGAEAAALGWFAGFGWSLDHGPEAALHAPGAERGDDVLGEHLRTAFARLNPDLLDEALHDSGRKLICPEGTILVTHNRAVHRMAVDGDGGVSRRERRDPARVGSCGRLRRQATGRSRAVPPQWDLHMILILMIPMTMEQRFVRMNPIRDVKEEAAAALGSRR